MTTPPFRRVLIANRGEIAVRIIRTCRRLGIETVAVHSDADADALHVRLADRAVRIGRAAPAESYLQGARIVKAALETGSEAIHPGYGFLSESPAFAEAVAEAGLIFIGPSAEAIRAMGLKDAAKRRMEEAGVPVVPGYHGPDQDDARLTEEAARIGFPLLVKAVAGGGGKGMRRVQAPGDLPEALRAARAEAAAAFGNDALLIERYVSAPRHIEVQIFGDGQSAIHLFERDCSLQRRHQKVLEEAPAPGISPRMRRALAAAAIRAAEAIGYAGAGTVEFIADGTRGLRPDAFWFMEMNTRLQVEHPVTEAVTGLDLVEWQLRLAAGEGLPLRQEDVTLTGHAVEVRLYAEDVGAGFLPATGRLTGLVWPEGLRVDSGVEAGDEITPHYDPMIAKLVAHGPDRTTALVRLATALGDCGVGGVVTNLRFLRRLVDHPDVRAGRLDTGLIGREIATLSGPPDVSPACVAQAALMLTGLDRAAGWERGFVLWAPLDHRVALKVEDEALDVILRVSSATVVDVRVGDIWVAARRRASGWTYDDGPARPLLIGGDVATEVGGGARIARLDPLARHSSLPEGDVVVAPMPGHLRKLYVSPGDDVQTGDRLALLEAMKMEHVLCAPRSGRVAATPEEEGAQVASGALLVQLDPQD